MLVMPPDVLPPDGAVFAGGVRLVSNNARTFHRQCLFGIWPYVSDVYAFDALRASTSLFIAFKALLTTDSAVGL